MKRSLAWFAVFFAIWASGQETAQVGETAGAATANRIAGLSQEFERAKGMDLDRVAAEIHRAIDEHISMAVSPNAFDPKAVQERLRRLLGAAANGGPYAFAVRSRNDRHLVIALDMATGSNGRTVLR